jgi:hypothetical protein
VSNITAGQPPRILGNSLTVEESPLFIEMPRRRQAVEKVAAGEIGGPEAGSKRPKTGLSALE